jgi:HK97 family phage major capsid protein
MDRIKQLEANRAERRKEIQALLATAAADKRNLTAEEQAKATALEADLDSIEATIKLEQKQVEWDRTSALAVDQAQPVITGGTPRAADAPWGEGLAGLAEQCAAIIRAGTGGGVDPRLYRAAPSGLNEALGPDGGFAIAPEYGTQIEKAMFDVGDLLGRVDARNILGNSITYPVMRETSRADGSRQGGVLGYWLDEAGSPTASKFQLDKMELKLRKVAALGYWTEELAQDAPALGQELFDAFVRELTFQAEDAIVRGNGTTRPQGFLQAPCLVTAAIEAGQTLAASAFINTNISKMWLRMRPRNRANAIWLCNTELEPWLDILSIPAGTGALEPRYVNYGPDGVLRIKGRPVVFSEYPSALGTVGDIALIDPKEYRLIRKGGAQTASSIHVGFAAGEVALRAVWRVDGQMVPRSAITPYKGSATTSPAVTLATRS